jgi:predicted TIM-barrel fold metal-dependent hydrolase
MFAADYPFESAKEAGAFMDEVALAEPVRKAIAADNAANYLGLSQLATA